MAKENKEFKSEQNYVYIKTKKDYGILDKYTIATFVCDRKEKEEFIVELLFGICRAFHSIPYVEKDNIITLDEAIALIKEKKENELKKLENCKRFFIPCEYKIRIYQKLRNEISTMKQKLEFNEYDINRIFVIERAIQQKEKGMRRIRKYTYERLKRLNLRIEDINFKNYNQNLIEKNIRDYEYLLNKLYEAKLSDFCNLSKK